MENLMTKMTAKEVYDLLWAITGENHPEGQEFDVDCDEQFVAALIAKGFIAEAAWGVCEIWSITISDGGSVEDFVEEYNKMTNTSLCDSYGDDLSQDKNLKSKTIEEIEQKAKEIVNEISSQQVEANKKLLQMRSESGGNLHFTCAEMILMDEVKLCQTKIDLLNELFS